MAALAEEIIASACSFPAGGLVVFAPADTYKQTPFTHQKFHVPHL